jgi:hypothetical protein
MNVVKKTLSEYVAPETKVLNVQPEGVLCSSVFNGHDGFTFDQEEDL